jgi:hypothetical protein
MQNVHLKEITQYKIAEMIQQSVPATQKLIAEAVMTDLNTWLYRIRESSQFLGKWPSIAPSLEERDSKSERKDGSPG